MCLILYVIASRRSCTLAAKQSPRRCRGLLREDRPRNDIIVIMSEFLPGAWQLLRQRLQAP